MCLKWGYSIRFLCFGILLGGLTQLGLHFFMYFKKHFRFGAIDAGAISAFKSMIKRFCACLLGASVLEVNAFIDGIIGSYLSKGSISILYYGTRFMHIPLDVFAIALSTILLPYFSRIILYAPRRMRFYLLEVSKFVAWGILPIVFFLIFHAEKILSMFLPAKKSTLLTVSTAKWVLIIYAIGLVFFSLNKLLVSMLYAYRDARSTSIGFVVSSSVNMVSSVIGAYFFDVYGVAAATIISGSSLTCYLLYALHKRHNITFYAKRYGVFLTRYFVHLTCALLLYLSAHYSIFYFLKKTSWYSFFYYNLGYWLIAFPLVALMILFLFTTRRYYKIRLYFL